MLKLAVLVLLCSFQAPFAWAGPTGRIVGGNEAKTGQFKYQVSLRKSGSHICGGSIISKNYILTAAHCVTEDTGKNTYKVYDARTLTIRAGSVDRFSGGVIKQVDNVLVHQNYGNFLYDVALLRLAEPLIFSNYIEAIPLGDTETPVNANVTISGWGRIKTGGASPQFLKYNVLQTISTLKCTVKAGMNANTLLCLGHNAGDGACNGDSGGPAEYNGKLVGVAGFVLGGCGTNNPDGYAKVFSHLEWIKRNYDV